MNKLYTINFRLSNGYIISVFNCWTQEILNEKIAKNPEWKFIKIADNDLQLIYDAY